MRDGVATPLRTERLCSRALTLHPEPRAVIRRFAVTPAALLVALTALALASPAPLQSQESGSRTAAEPCPRGRISVIFIDNNSVFEVEEKGTGQSFRWAYKLANSLHVRTRRGFLRKELLFDVGDCYDPLRLAESERLIRAFPFIARVDVFGLEQPDGSWHVVVDTQDDWTTELNVRFAFEEGPEFRGIDLTEENVLGRGVLAGFFFFRRDERRDIGGRIITPRVAGTRLDAELSAGQTRIGSFVRQELFYPFVGEVGRLAGRQIYERRDDQFNFRIGSEEGFTDLLLPLEEERFEITMVGRLGEPGSLTVLGLGVSDETLEFPGFPDAVEVVREGDFGDAQPAPDSLASLLRDQTLFSSGTRLNFIVGQRNVRFVERTGLDALTGVQDVTVGFDAGLTLGTTLGGLSGGEDTPDDLFTRVRLFGGTAPGPFVMNLDLAFDGRHVFSGGRAGDGWRDLIAELDGLFYWQPAAFPAHTFFARASGAGGWETVLPFQLTLGGVEGVRGYRDEQFPAARRLIFSFEDRIYLAWPAPELFDFGFTLFGDVGRGWAGDVPFGTDAGWRAAVGGGLRIGFPAGTRGVARLDVAYPLDGDGFDDVILRFTLLDLLGLQGGIEDRELERVRRNTVGSDMFTVGR